MRPVQGHPRRRAAQQRTGGSQRTSPASVSHPRRPFSSSRAGACRGFLSGPQQHPGRRLPRAQLSGPSGSTRPRPGLSAAETLASEPTQPAPGATQPCGQRRGGWGVTTPSRAGAVAEARPSPRCGSTTPRTPPCTQAGGPATAGRGGTRAGPGPRTLRPPSGCCRQNWAAWRDSALREALGGGPAGSQGERRSFPGSGGPGIDLTQ